MMGLFRLCWGLGQARMGSVYRSSLFGVVWGDIGLSLRWISGLTVLALSAIMSF